MRTVKQFVHLFYGTVSTAAGVCTRCGDAYTSYWDHLLYPCSQLHLIAESDDWQALCSLLVHGY